MFAPPDPATPMPVAPPPPPPSLLVPPAPGLAATLTHPGATTAPAPAVPVVPTEAPQEPAFRPHLAAVPPIVQPDATPVNVADDPTERPATAEERPAAPRRLIRTSWLRRLAIWGNAGAVPGAFVGDYVGAGLLFVGLVALVVWSGLIAVNVRRAQHATRHGKAPHPLAAFFSWMLAPLAAVVAAFGIGAVAAWAEAGTFDEQGSRTMALAGAVFAAGVVVLIAMYQPYRILARCAKWANSDGGLFRKWFVAPIIAVLVAIGLQLFATLVVLTDNADGSSGTATIGAAAVLITAVTLPWLAWLYFGSRAMRSLESGVANVHDRAVRESQDPAAADSLLAGHVATAPAGAVAVSAPNA